MNIACRCPFAPTTWVWNVIDSSTIGWKPGNAAVAGEHLLDGDARVPRAEQVDEPAGGDRVGAAVARGLEGVALRLLDAVEQPAGGRDPAPRRHLAHPALPANQPSHVPHRVV